MVCIKRILYSQCIHGIVQEKTKSQCRKVDHYARDYCRTSNDNSIMSIQYYMKYIIVIAVFLEALSSSESVKYHSRPLLYSC